MMAIERTDILYPGRRRSPSFFCEGGLLQVDEIREALEEYAEEHGQRIEMLSKFRNADQYFPHLLSIYRSLAPVSFPVFRLKHVTIRNHFLNILDEEGFRGSDIEFILKGEEKNLRVSCWGVDILHHHIENAKDELLNELMEKLSEEDVTNDHLSGEDIDGVRDMLANSPALRQDSRYGNFQFSFPIEDLLGRYKVQHCKGMKPVLRVMGTETYKHEIVHWILIHSPHCKDFNHLPKVSWREPVYWDGSLMWEPESVTNLFTWCISNGDLEKKPERFGKFGLMQTYDPWVWNNPVFAFHLPGKRTLWMDRSWLLENVEACEMTESFGPTTLRHPEWKYLSEEEAEEVIDNAKEAEETSSSSDEEDSASSSTC